MSEAPKVWLTRKEASIYLGSQGCPVSAATLCNMAGNNNAGGGPAYTASGWKTIRYKRSDLDDWVRRRARRVA